MRTIEWKDDGVYLIDQTKLPDRLEVIRCTDHERVARAIESMEIRGAPAIGVAAAMGVALAAKNSRGRDVEGVIKDLEEASERLRSTRPTARNLFWALERMRGVWERGREGGLEGGDEGSAPVQQTRTGVEPAAGRSGLVAAVIEEAIRIAEEDVVMCRAIGRHGTEVIADGDRILTHCNAGGLACVDHGTALGVIKSAFEAGRRIFVYATETRPLLQGARLTAFELREAGIPFKLITDNMVAFHMQKGLITKVVVGADRITRQGDVVNKIGTYGIAVLAKAHGIPFYVAAPSSTIDLTIERDRITIEERSPSEVTHVRGVKVTPDGVDVANPAFDMTPRELVSGIITEGGILRPPYDLSVPLGQGHE